MRYRAAVDERDHVAVAASLAPFFAPRTVAVVGASTRRGSIGGELFRNILDSGFDGAAYPVNPKAAAVAGVRAYASIADIPDPVDLAVFCVPGESVLAGGRGRAPEGHAGRSASSRPASRRRVQTASVARTSCSRACAPTARR